MTKCRRRVERNPLPAFGRLLTLCRIHTKTANAYNVLWRKPNPQRGGHNGQKRETQEGRGENRYRSGKSGSHGAPSGESRFTGKRGIGRSDQAGRRSQTAAREKREAPEERVL